MNQDGLYCDLSFICSVCKKTINLTNSLYKSYKKNEYFYDEENKT